LLKIVSGTTPIGMPQDEKYPIPFIGGKQISPEEKFEKVVPRDAPRIPKEYHEGKLKISQLKKNDLLITMAGFGIGRCGVYETTDEANANQAVAILRVNNDRVIPKYVMKYLHSRVGQLILDKLRHFSRQPNINLDEITCEIPIILPEKKNQIQILNAIKPGENKIKLIDDEIQVVSDETNQIMLKELKISILPHEKTYFFKTGRDITSSYHSEDFNFLNDRLDYRFFDPKLHLIDEFKQKYSWITLNQIAKIPIVRGDQPEYVEEEGIIAIKTIDLKDGYIDYDNCLRTSKENYDKCITAHVQKNDILIASTGYMSIGKVDIYDSDEAAMVDGHVAILRLDDGYDPQFVTYFLRSHIGKIQFEKWWTGSSGQIEVPPSELEKFTVPSNSKTGISFKKQIKIAEKISDSSNRVTNLKQQKNKLRIQIDKKFGELIGIQ